MVITVDYIILYYVWKCILFQGIYYAGLSVVYLWFEIILIWKQYRILYNVFNNTSYLAWIWPYTKRIRRARVFRQFYCHLYTPTTFSCDEVKNKNKTVTFCTSGYGHFSTFKLIMDWGVRLCHKLEIYLFTGIAHNRHKHHHPLPIRTPRE